MGNIQSYIASKQLVSAGGLGVQALDPWGGGDWGSEDLEGGKEAIIPAHFWGYCSETTGILSLQGEVCRLGSKGRLK